MTTLTCKLPHPNDLTDTGEIVRLFLPECQLVPVKRLPQLRLDVAGKKQQWVATATINGIGEGRFACPRRPDAMVDKRMRRRAAKMALYLAFRQHYPAPAWGALTGVRPTKLAYTLLDECPDMAHVLAELEQTWQVGPDKIALMERILATQQGWRVPPTQAAGEYDVYIGIPFCPTRCSYCSFCSLPLTSKYRTLVEPYLEALKLEMRLSAPLMWGKRLRSLYIGGGTPTILTPDQLLDLLRFAQRLFGTPIETTVEAGRPDTITQGHVDVFRAMQVDRVSVNPQSTDPDTLARIGRGHTVDQLYQAYDMCRVLPTINMDIIAGLPGESFDAYAKTLADCLAMAPENLTVHTLALKRSSALWGAQQPNQQPEMVQAMLQHTYDTVLAQGYDPYYLYRQKYMTANLENVGFCRNGRVGRYNIDNMEETHTVMAFGAGAITKRIAYPEYIITRAVNLRDVGQYLARLEEQVARKQSLFFEELPLG